jgi:hypothetical protein
MNTESNILQDKKKIAKYCIIMMFLLVVLGLIQAYSSNRTGLTKAYNYFETNNYTLNSIK